MGIPKKRNTHIPSKWFFNIKRHNLFAGLIREGWKKRIGAKHIQFIKQGYGKLIFRHGGKSPPDTLLTAKDFREAGITREEAARILGRKSFRQKRKLIQ